MIMKRTLFLFALLMLLSMRIDAASVEVKTNLWSCSVSMGNWAAWQSVEAAAFANAKVGNKIAVSYTTESADGQMALKTMSDGWPLLKGTDFVTLPASTKATYYIVITQDMLDELKASGLVVSGSNYTATSIDLVKQVEASDGEKGNPINTVWTGSKAIDWNGTNGWQTLDKSFFADAKVGNRLRFNYASLAIGAQGHLSTGDWKDMPDGAEYKQLTSTYFEYAITADMLAKLQENGCIVTGVGYTLTSVDIVDPTQIPNIVASVDKSYIKCWEKGETPALRVSLQNIESKEQTVAVKVALRTDAYTDVNVYSKNVAVASSKTGYADITMPELAPGFYHAVVTANYQEVADFNIGYDPTSIVSAPDAQSDFKEFWDKAKSDLAKVTPNYKLTKIDSKSTAKRNVYLVEMQSIDDGDGNPVTIRGYYAEPVAEGTYPVIITQNGYDSDAANHVALDYCPDCDGNEGWIELNLSVRGQVINNHEPNKNIYGDWFAYNFGNKDKYYYRGAYMDVVRGIDFIASRAKAQKNNIFMTGGSQGGAFTIIGAALDTRIKAIAPAVQFMGDFPDYFRVGSWPASVAKEQQKKLGMSDEDMYKFLTYFDTKNFAPYITCPVFTCMGLQDPVCPPHTNFAPYNNLKVADKQYTVNADCKHETPSTWWNDYMNFFKSHINDSYPTAISGVSVQKRSVDNVIYSIDGRSVGNDTTKLLSGVYVMNGKKFVVK